MINNKFEKIKVHYIMESWEHVQDVVRGLTEKLNSIKYTDRQSTQGKNNSDDSLDFELEQNRRRRHFAN